MTCGTLAHWANKLTVHAPPPPPNGRPPGIALFWKIPRYVELALRKVLNPPPTSDYLLQNCSHASNRFTLKCKYYPTKHNRNFSSLGKLSYRGFVHFNKIIHSRKPTCKVAWTYLCACWLCLNCVFQQKRFNRFLLFLASLIKNGRTLRNHYLFSFWYKKVWDIGIYLKPNFAKNVNNFEIARQIFQILKSIVTIQLTGQTAGQMCCAVESDLSFFFMLQHTKLWFYGCPRTYPLWRPFTKMFVNVVQVIYQAWDAVFHAISQKRMRGARVSSGVPNTEKRVENARRSGVFWTMFVWWWNNVLDITSQTKWF